MKFLTLMSLQLMIILTPFSLPFPSSLAVFVVPSHCNLTRWVDQGTGVTPSV